MSARRGVPNLNGGNLRGSRGGRWVAKGQRVSETMIKTNVTFDDETFEEIRARAVKRKHSFCAEMRDLAEIGLETVKAEGI